MKKLKYDIEKNQKVIDSLSKYSWLEVVLFYVFFGLGYLGYDLQLHRFYEFFLLNGFLILIWFICEVILIAIHYSIKYIREKDKVGEQHENK